MPSNSYEYFLDLSLKEYSDEWIAIIDNKVVSHGNNAKTVFSQAKKLFPKSRPLLAKVPGKMAMIL